MAFEVSITAAYMDETRKTKQNSTSEEAVSKAPDQKTQAVVSSADTLRIT